MLNAKLARILSERYQYRILKRTLNEAIKIGAKSTVFNSSLKEIYPKNLERIAKKGFDILILYSSSEITTLKFSWNSGKKSNGLISIINEENILNARDYIEMLSDSEETL